MIKCQHCSKQATIHITEIVKGKPLEYHLCEEHARQQLANEPTSDPSPAKAKLAKTTGKGRDVSALDQQTCPMCGISFLDFRNAGRLGCPHDYEAFRDELMQLLESIHGETRHQGKLPRRAPVDHARLTTLMQLRQSLKKAIENEDYESAARVRDQIRAAEQRR